MKYIIAFLIAFGGVGLVFADSEIRILENGQVLTKGGGWVVSDIKVTEEAKKYPAFISRAYDKPDIGIVVKIVTLNTVVSSLFLEEKTSKKTTMKYDYKKGQIDVEDSVFTNFVNVAFPVLSLIMMVLMGLSLFIKSEDYITLVSVYILIFLVALFSFGLSLDVLGERQLPFGIIALLILGGTWFAVRIDGRRIRSAVSLSFVLMLVQARIFYDPLF